MKRHPNWLLFVICGLMLAACNKDLPATPPPFMASATPPPIMAWWDAPLPGAHLPLEPVALTFHGASPAGIDSFDIQINGVAFKSVAPQGTESGGSQYGTLFWGETNWTPTAPGTYLLGVRAKEGGGQTGSYVQIQVVVGEGPVAEISTPLPLLPTPTVTPAEAPALLPSTEPLSPPTFSTDTLYYRLASCGPKEVAIGITANDPQVYSVVLFYRLKMADGGDQTEWMSLAMNPQGGGAFSRTLNAEADFPGFAAYTDALLQVQFVATDQGGNEVARTGVFSDVAFKLCTP